MNLGINDVMSGYVNATLYYNDFTNRRLWMSVLGDSVGIHCDIVDPKGQNDPQDITSALFGSDEVPVTADNLKVAAQWAAGISYTPSIGPHGKRYIPWDTDLQITFEDEDIEDF